MNNEERDEKISATHDAVIVMVKQVKDHNEALFGNSKPGMVKDVTLLQERQDQCPARKATTIEGKRLSLSTILMIVGIVGLVANLAFAILNWVHKQ